jgi:branched-chain amino acid transport system substrate-binding protein
MRKRKEICKGKKLTRREFLETAGATTAAIGGSLAFPGILRYGRAGDTIKVGCVYATSGHMAVVGRDNVEACKLAVEEINAKGGVLGKEVELLVRDDAAKPHLSATRVKELIEKDKIKYLLGANTGGTVAAMHAQTAPRKVLFMATAMNNDITAVPMFNKYSFHVDVTPHMMAQVMGKFAAEKLGRKWCFLVADYAWGWQNYHSFSEVLTEYKGENLGVLPHPAGTSDYSSYVGKIMAAKPEVLMIANAGKDQINSWKQLREFGAFEKMKIVGILFMPGTIWSVGIDSVWGGYGGATFYWEDPDSKKFSDAYWKRWGHAPSDDSAVSYDGAMELFAAMERARSLEVDKIITELEGHRFRWTKGDEWWRPCDHQVVQDCFVLECKKPTEKKYDTFRIIDKIGGEQIMRSCERLGHKKT